MPLPKLSPLQSRLAASLIASCMLLMLYFSFSSSSFAYAADVDSIAPEDHNHERLLHSPILDLDLEELELADGGYEADFVGSDRGIIGRAPTANDPSPLLNNRPVLTNVPQGTTISYMFSNTSLWNSSVSVQGIQLPSLARLEQRSWKRDGANEDMLGGDQEDVFYGDGVDGEIELVRRQRVTATNRTLYVTISVCLQPEANEEDNLGQVPQMKLYVSQSPNNTNPGPDSDASLQQMVTLDGGWGMVELNATGNVYIGITAPNTTSFTGPYSASLAASIDRPYHSYNSEQPNLHLVDSDAISALFITDNLTTEDANSTVYQSWMSMAPPFVMFANNKSDPIFAGIQNSYCGLEAYAKIPQVGSLQAGMTASGLGNHPKQQFYINGLTKASTYFGIVALPSNNTESTGVVGGGGEVWRTMEFTTLADDNCAVIFNLSFCSESSYAVPGNSITFPNITELASFYDDAVREQYSYFEKALAQIPCEATPSAQYSLAKGCDDCAADYKDWLCSVMLPRCTDFSSSRSWLQKRNMAQAFPNGTTLDAGIVSAANQSAFLRSSRNPAIDERVQPGPYNEVLPCDDLCYDIVQSCPASMGFSCPLFGQLGFNQSYGKRPDDSPEQKGQITCNFPGAAYFLAATGTRGTAPVLPALAIAAMLGLALFM
ncbi:calcium influx-promoting protein ehs1 [Phlyctema vagabunda]|uniref:Calcium influx-promoting protein ehs1 n=1 Tax=Phlyctema vagabunda TaxID=108571 RepID=A0ABR4PUP0_9HELO